LQEVTLRDTRVIKPQVTRVIKASCSLVLKRTGFFATTFIYG